MVYFMENPMKKWMMTGGTPILGTPHMLQYQWIIYGLSKGYLWIIFGCSMIICMILYEDYLLSSGEWRERFLRSELGVFAYSPD